MGVDVLFYRTIAHSGCSLYDAQPARRCGELVITASHNPYTDNGIKFFRADGYKLDEKIAGK